MTSSGPRRRFSEPTAADAVTHTVWVRTLPKPFTGTVDEAWLTAAVQANALRVPDVLAIAMQYIRGAAALLDGPLQIAGDAEYGPLVNGERKEGADFNDYLGVTWTYADAVDPPETRQFRSLDCSGFVRMIWGYRHSLPGQPRRDRVPLTLAPTSSRRAMPRRAFEICQSAPGVVTIENDGGQVQDLSALAVGDLVFFDADEDDGPQLDHVGIYLGSTQAGITASSRAARARTVQRWATTVASPSSTGPASTRPRSARPGVSDRATAPSGCRPAGRLRWDRTLHGRTCLPPAGSADSARKSAPFGPVTHLAAVPGVEVNYVVH